MNSKETLELKENRTTLINRQFNQKGILESQIIAPSSGISSGSSEEVLLCVKVSGSFDLLDLGSIFGNVR